MWRTYWAIASAVAAHQIWWWHWSFDANESPTWPLAYIVVGFLLIDFPVGVAVLLLERGPRWLNRLQEGPARIVAGVVGAYATLATIFYPAMSIFLVLYGVTGGFI